MKCGLWMLCGGLSYAQLATLYTIQAMDLNLVPSQVGILPQVLPGWDGRR